MGKSPGKWIKTVLFGKKSSKSNLSKDASSEIKKSITGKAQSKDFGADAMIISSPVRPVIDSSGEHAELEKSSSANLMPDTAENLQSPMEFYAANNEELIKLERAATKAQAAFRGYLARRAFWALKGIIRLQALVRGHLVRRQAVATLSCMRAIIAFQALVRGRMVRLSGNGQVLQKYITGGFVHKKSSELLVTSLREEKLSTNGFVTKLVALSHTTKPISLQYDPLEPNSVRSWLERWSYSCFWEPLPQPKKTLEAKPKRKQTGLQAEETETGRPKRSVRRVSVANSDNGLSVSSDNEKSRRTVRKLQNHQADSVQEQSLNELEKVKRNLRKISVSTSGAPEKSEIDTEKPAANLNKVSSSPTPEFSKRGTNDPVKKMNGSYVENVKQPEPEEPHPVQPLEDKPHDVLQDVQPSIEPPSMEISGKLENKPPANVESNGKEDHGSKENQRTRRRKSLPVKQEYNESASQNTPTLPSYMAATESAKAKLRAQAAAKAAEEAENGFSRRHSLPTSISKQSLSSPRVQKPLHANGKGGSKPYKSQTSAKDEKVLQAGWRR